MCYLRESFMNSLFWQSVTWRPGTPALSLDSEKHHRCPTRRHARRPREIGMAGPELRSGYALPPFRAGATRLIMIVAAVSP